MRGGRANDQRLAAAATVWRRAAVPVLRRCFISAGLAGRFSCAAERGDGCDALGAERSHAEPGTPRRCQRGLRQKLTDGRRNRSRPDAFVKSALKDNPSLLANWKVVKPRAEDDRPSTDHGCPTDHAADAPTPRLRPPDIGHLDAGGSATRHIRKSGAREADCQSPVGQTINLRSQ